MLPSGDAASMAPLELFTKEAHFGFFSHFRRITLLKAPSVRLMLLWASVVQFSLLKPNFAVKSETKVSKILAIINSSVCMSSSSISPVPLRFFITLLCDADFAHQFLCCWGALHCFSWNGCKMEPPNAGKSQPTGQVSFEDRWVFAMCTKAWFCDSRDDHQVINILKNLQQLLANPVTDVCSLCSWNWVSPNCILSLSNRIPCARHLCPCYSLNIGISLMRKLENLWGRSGRFYTTNIWNSHENCSMQCETKNFRMENFLVNRDNSNAHMQPWALHTGRGHRKPPHHTTSVVGTCAHATFSPEHWAWTQKAAPSFDDAVISRMWHCIVVVLWIFGFFFDFNSFI